MLRLRPQLPRHSTVFFSQVPSFIGWQAADGPLLRWAYRDSSLRSYFLSEFTLDRAKRGPLFVFTFERGLLRDWSEHPQLLPGIAYSMLLVDEPRAAGEALDLDAQEVGRLRYPYWRAWIHLSLGNRSECLSLLQKSTTVADELALTERYERSAQESLVQRIKESPLELATHLDLAKQWLPDPATRQQGVVEAYAAKTIAPGNLSAWRTWSHAQFLEGQVGSALLSLEHSRMLLQNARLSDSELEAELRRMKAIRDSSLRD
jgi:hypothetical protein